jgi:hypothetical protein
MQNNFIINFQNYLSIVTLKKFNLLDYIEEGDYKLEPIAFLLKYKDVFEDTRIARHIFDRMFYALVSLGMLESEKAEKETLSSIAKERKNIQSLQKSIIATKNIFDYIDDEQTSNKLNILEHIFKLFEENDEATIELLCTAKFISDYVKSGAMTFASIEFHMPDFAKILRDNDGLFFAASLIRYFEGYRITPEMFLHSLAIKLFNYHIYIGLDSEIKSTVLAKSIEDLLSPFSKNGKLRVIPDRAKKFYIKSMYKNHYILAYSGKKNKERFSYIFNPEAFYLPARDKWVKADPDNVESGELLFETADDYYSFATHIIYSNVILTY